MGRGDERRRRRVARWAVACALAVGTPAAAGAQEIPPPPPEDLPSAAVALVGGAFNHNLMGSSTVPFGAVRIPLPMSSHIVIEPGFEYTSYTSSDGEDIPLLIPEAQLQGQLTYGRWRPFVGAGAGGMFDLREERSGQALVVWTASAGGGTRFTLGRGFSARAELRARVVDGTDEGAVEWTLGIEREF